METNTAALGTTLHHVLFFLEKNQKQEETPSPTDSTATNDSALTATTTMSSAISIQTPATTRDSSPVCYLGASTPKSTTSPLKADAPDFVPLAAAVTPIFELRPSAGKGLGLFACRDLPRGTRIICEAPLLEVPQKGLDVAYHAYLQLPADKKLAFDALHCYVAPQVDYEHVARMCAMHCQINEHDLPEYVQEHVRVMGTFACNDFILANGNIGAFEISSRLNHSCVPNVHHTNNPALGKETVQTVRDVRAGEELLINYLGPASTYDFMHQRLQKLRDHYGFECQCIACTDVTGASDQRREILSGIFWGLNQFASGAQPDGRFIPNSPQTALVQAEDSIRFLIEEQLLSVELLKAYRVAAGFALSIGNYEKALEYAFNEEEIERNILGVEVDDLEKINMAAKQWVETVYLTAIRAGVNFKSNFLRLLSPRIQQAVQAMEAKRVASKHAMKRGSKQNLSKKKSFTHAQSKKKSNRSPRKKTQVQDENIAPPATTGEDFQD
ncbi:putative SET domain, tetratricopeptide-like helical domain superfamily [Septoria linicola]|nr:putative SET domain, tetratricopeptide-like helical domain superfamily [Septoria linicola]